MILTDGSQTELKQIPRKTEGQSGLSYSEIDSGEVQLSTGKEPSQESPVEADCQTNLKEDQMHLFKFHGSKTVSSIGRTFRTTRSQPCVTEGHSSSGEAEKEQSGGQKNLAENQTSPKECQTNPTETSPTVSLTSQTESQTSLTESHTGPTESQTSPSESQTSPTESQSGQTNDHRISHQTKPNNRLVTQYEDVMYRNNFPFSRLDTFPVLGSKQFFDEPLQKLPPFNRKSQWARKKSKASKDYPTSIITADHERVQMQQLQNECRPRLKVVGTKYDDLDSKQKLETTQYRTKQKIKTHNSRKDDKRSVAVPSKTVNKWPYDKEFYKVINPIRIHIFTLNTS